MSRLEQRLEKLYHDAAVGQSAAGSFHDPGLIALSSQVSPDREVAGEIIGSGLRGGRYVGGAYPCPRARGTPRQKAAAAANSWNIFVRGFWSPGMPWSEAIKHAVASGKYVKKSA
jgi:hypothetical protein